MRTEHPIPETPGDTSPRMLKKLAALHSISIYAIIDAGPEDKDSGKFYVECYWEASRRERAAIDSQEF